MTPFTKLGKYLIRGELGQGAMGIVYEGFDPVIERTVAIKTILPGRLNSGEAVEVLTRFKREAQLAGRFNHPGIIAIYDYGEVVPEYDSALGIKDNSLAVDGKPPTPIPFGAERVAYIAMEFVKGRELRDYFDANERFDLPAVARLMGELLSALGHAHAPGVVHRDIKPANLIVLETGQVKIADFGIARIETSELTQMGTIMGTPAYMSPEQFTGQKVDSRSDLFSCAIVLYQFLTGEKPFTGNTTTIMYKVLREEPLAPSLLNTSLPPALDEVLKKAIAKRADQRFQTAAEFNAALQAAITWPTPACAGSNVNAAAVPSTAAVTQASQVLNNASTPTPAQAAKVVNAQSTRAFGIAMLAGSIVVAGLGAYLWTVKQQMPAAPTVQTAPAVAPATAVPPAPPSMAQKLPLAGSAAVAPASTPTSTSRQGNVPAPPVETMPLPPLTKAATAPVKAASAVQSVPERASRPAPPVTPRVREPAPDPTPTQTPTPPPKPQAVPRGPRSPQEACAGRVFLSLAFCLQSQCNSDHFHNHPQCVEMRKQQEEAAQRLRNNR